jgi:hypothetical protein
LWPGDPNAVDAQVTATRSRMPRAAEANARDSLQPPLSPPASHPVGPVFSKSTAETGKHDGEWPIADSSPAESLWPSHQSSPAATAEPTRPMTPVSWPEFDDGASMAESSSQNLAVNASPVFQSVVNPPTTVLASTPDSPELRRNHERLRNSIR